jgi:hypothetical protein
LVDRHDIEPVISGRGEVLHILDDSRTFPSGSGKSTHHHFSRLSVIELGLGARRCDNESPSRHARANIPATATRPTALARFLTRKSR